MGHYQLLLFDLDDTLFDFNACWDAGMKEALRVYPVTHDFETDTLFLKMKQYGDSLWHLIEEKKMDFHHYRRMRFQLTMRDMGLEITDEEADAFQRLFMVKNKEAITPKPQLVTLFTELSKSYQLGLVTNGPADQCYDKVERIGLTPFFPAENIFVSEEVGHYKPEPEIYQIALEHFGVRPANTLFIGDSWLHDVAGPIALGMDAVWLNWKQAQPSTEHTPLAVITDLKELPSLLKTAPITT